MADQFPGSGKRGFACRRFPGFNIADRVIFRDGAFETDDPSLIELIESNSWYGVHIHPRETQEEIDAMRGGAAVPLDAAAVDAPDGEDIPIETASTPQEFAVEIEEENPAAGRSRARQGATSSRNVR